MQMNTIYCSDNFDILKQLASENHRFDLVLTDPPYNVGKDFDNDTDKQTSNQFLNDLDIRMELAAMLLNTGGGLIVFASHLYVARIQMMLEKYLIYRRLMIWHYKNGMSRQSRTPVTEYEPFLWFSKDDNWVYNADDVRVPYRSERVKNPVYKTNSKGEKIAWNPDPRGAKRGDVWEYPCLAGKVYEDERTPHPTQKPISLTVDLIKAFCPKNQLGLYEGKVLDIYAGSGTTLVACQMLNSMGHKIEWIGVELEQRWVDEGNKRLDDISDKYLL
jgi:DNA modification methylase